MSGGITSANCSLTTSNASGTAVSTIGSNIALSVVVGFIAITSVLSNGLVIACVAKTPRLQNPANLMLCSLSLSDLFTGLTVMPLFVATRLLFIHISVSICVYRKVLMAFLYSFFLSSSTSFPQLCLLSWDRYKAVSNPLVYRSNASKRKTLTGITVMWLSLITWNIVLLTTIPRPQRDYAHSVIGALWLLFPVIMQVAMYKAIRHHNRQMIGTESQAAAATALAREKKILITLRYVMAALGFSLAIPLVVQMVMTSRGRVEYTEQEGTAWTIVFVFMNSCINPIIYFLRHPDMRTAAFRLIGH